MQNFILQKRQYLSTIFLFLSLLLFSDNVNYGIYMRSYPASASSWSELELDNGKSFHLGRQFSIAFDLQVRDECPFGYIFRAVTDTNEHIDLLLSVGSNDERLPSLRVQDSVYLLPNEIDRNKWLNVEVKINTSKQKIHYQIGDQSVEIPFNDLKAKHIRFIFGKSNVEGLETKDIASVNLRDIRIEKNGSLIRHWPLKKHQNNVSYDEIKNAEAITKNTEWLIDNHVILKPLFQKDFQLAPSVGFNSNTGVFYLSADSESIIIFDAKSLSTDTLVANGGNFVTQSPNHLMFIDDKNDLISYRITNQRVFSFYDFVNDRWSNNEVSFGYSYEHSYWNNSTVYNQKDASILSFGGYGYYRFNNNLVTIYPYEANADNTLKTLNDISPRSASASVIVGDTLYIFGGRGSASGQQELGPVNFYDSYAVDLNTLEVQKLWNINNVEKNYLPSENLIYDGNQHCFYTFITQSGGKIVKLLPDKNVIEDLSFLLDIDFSSQYQYTNFYYSDVLKKYYVFVNLINVDNTAKVSIYSIDAPLIPINSILVLDKAKRKSVSALFLILISILLIGLIRLYFYYKNRTNGLQIGDMDDTDKIDSNILDEQMPTSESYSKNICFFGLFQVFDQEGNEISDDFSPTLRKLLILLVVCTQNDNGISGKEMTRILWPDKDDDLAKNSRNVYISKLRALLDKIGNIEVVNKNRIWSINMGDEIQCDYIDILRFIDQANNRHLTDEQVYEIIHILSRGALLPEFEYDWLDKYKNNFSNQTIDMLYKLLDNEGLKDAAKLKISDILFQLDYLNEHALISKCVILSKYGKKGLAKNVYDVFCSDYKNSLGVNYTHSFIDVLRMG